MANLAVMPIAVKEARPVRINWNCGAGKSLALSLLLARYYFECALFL